MLISFLLNISIACSLSNYFLISAPSGWIFVEFYIWSFLIALHFSWKEKSFTFHGKYIFSSPETMAFTNTSRKFRKDRLEMIEDNLARS